MGSQGAATTFEHRNADSSTHIPRYLGSGEDAQEDGATKGKFRCSRIDPAQGQQIYLDVGCASFLRSKG